MEYVSLIPKNNTEHIDRSIFFQNMVKEDRKRVHVRLSLWISVLVITLSVAAYPFVPLVMYHAGVFNTEGHENTAISAETEIENESEELSHSEAQNVASVTHEGKNMLVIPKIGVRMEIMGGNNSEYAWSKGAWLEPGTSTPDNGSNTVLSAHRFNYIPPHERTLYLLHKLEPGDTFSVFWEGKEYRYRMNESRITSPYALEVLEPSEKSMITIYTCNPIFSTAERLVVTAELVEII